VRRADSASKKFKKPKKLKPPYGWTRLPRVVVACLAPTYVVGLASLALDAFQGAPSGGVPTDHTAMRQVATFLETTVMVLMVVGTALATIMVRPRSDWSDEVIAIVLCILLGAVGLTLYRYRAEAMVGSERSDERRRSGPP
jgi:hypothetical protein